MIIIANRNSYPGSTNLQRDDNGDQLLTNGKEPNVQAYLGYGIIVAAVLGAVIIISISDLDTYPWVAVAGTAALCVYLFALNRPVIGLYILTLAAAFIDYKLIHEVRFFVGSIPINLIEIAIFFVMYLAVPSLLLNPTQKGSTHHTLKHGPFGLWIIFLVTISTFGFIRGAVSNSLYDASRDIRSVVLILISFLLTRKYVTSWKIWKTIATIIFLGGIYSIIIRVMSYLQPSLDFTSYLDIRSVVPGTASLEFTFILVVAFIVCRHYLFGRRYFTWILLLMSFLAYFLTFSMTAYIFMILVPVFSVLLSPSQLPKKLKIGLAMGCLPMIVLYYGVTTFAEIEGGGMFGNVLHLFGQATQQLLGLSSSIHAQSRLDSWNAALSELSGVQFLTGIGMGKRVFLDTQIPGIGVIVAGEPTYSTYLLGVGLIGSIVLLALQLRFVVVSYQSMKYAPDSFIRAAMLAFTVYGLTTIINGFFHNNFMSPQVSVLYGVMLGLVEGSLIRPSLAGLNVARHQQR